MKRFLLFPILAVLAGCQSPKPGPHPATMDLVSFPADGAPSCMLNDAEWAAKDDTCFISDMPTDNVHEFLKHPQINTDLLVPKPTHKAEAPSDSSKRLENELNEFTRRMQDQRHVLDWEADALKFEVACANVEGDLWDSRNCDARRNVLQKQGDAILRELEKLPPDERYPRLGPTVSPDPEPRP